MILQLTVLGQDAVSEKKWAADLESAISGMVDAQIGISAGGGELGQILFVDAEIDGLDAMLSQLDRKGRAVFLIVGEAAPLPSALVDGRVDDVLVFPFRSLEVLSKIRMYQQLMLWDEVTRLNDSFSGLLDRLQDDLKLAERMQKKRIPLRFPEVKGLKVASRYLAGLRSGGDHFDLAESQDKNQLSVILSDSSSYGLSSSVLSVLMRVTMKLSAEEVRSCESTVKKIQDELMLTLAEKDRLSLFYGVISRKDYGLRYLNLGTSCVLYARPKESFVELPKQGDPLTLKSGVLTATEQVLPLHPEGRLALISDGFSEALGGLVKVRELLDHYRGKDAVDCLNELVFRVKGQFTDEDEMPAQDCSAILLDVDSRLIRAVL